MNIELKDFQTDASDRLLQELRLAKNEIALASKTEAVILAAPTGSGKTIIAADMIERVLSGYDTHSPEPEAVFLWLTDQPELNEQTRRKIVSTSSVLGPDRLITVDSTFDEEVFSEGNVYFLNTQKLGKEKNLVEAGDKRSFTIWETIKNTVRRDPTKFYLIIDEAHRGMGVSNRDAAQAETIVQKFIKGSSGEIPPIPLLVGISATPERFRALLRDTPRVTRPVDVDPADVRASGLIKDFVRFRTPKEQGPSDISLLRDSVQRWNDYRQRWNAYCDAEMIATVKPLLIVQVEDGDANHITKTPLHDVMAAIEDVNGALPPEAYAHAFQEGTSIPVASRTVRYIAPSDITDDPHVQVVFFKTSLSTGWDCPRAEVMMSFRSATDATLIAQLVGRMVRTPLARRVNSDEMLNSVTLMLPHYDAEELRAVVARLKATDPDAMPPTEFEDDDEIEDLQRASSTQDCFDAASRLPTYVIPSRSRMSETRRLMKLARLLVQDNLNANAIDEARGVVFNVLDQKYAQVKESDTFKRHVDRASTLDVEEHTFEFGGELSCIPDSGWIDYSEADLDDRFADAGRRVGEGLHKAYWKHRVAMGESSTVAKRNSMALLMVDGAVSEISEAAKRQTSAWLAQHRAAIHALRDEQKQAYNEIMGATKEPLEDSLDLPESIEVAVKSDATRWMKHVYVNQRNEFKAKLNDWESRVMQGEIGRMDVVGWLRNVPRKPYALCVPYQDEDGKPAGLYPDFLVFRQTEHGIVADIVDPHLVKIDDAFRKAKGLAEYVDRHPGLFGRVLIARIEKGNIQYLDIADQQVRENVRRLNSNDHLRSLYDTLHTA